MIPDEIKELVTQARAGDRTAYGELVRRFEPTVHAVALSRLRNASEAQELVQEVFVHALGKLPQLRAPECFAGWLKQITVRMSINRLSRHGPVRPAESGVLDNVASASAGPLEAMLRAEQRAHLWLGLGRLKQLDRETLVAFYIRGRSLAQMSRDFETPIGTIKRRLHVARARLRRQLEKSTPAAGTRPPRPRRRQLACV
jgi:RNA polymerase sigma-70 factor (ECF subfamily)